jgi:CheY-like chemotaxis protein
MNGPARHDTVIIVEDEEEARTFLAYILELEGFSVAGFANGREALDYLQDSRQPCVIIADILMPVMNGFEFRAALLREPRFAGIPLIVVTALEPSAAAEMSAVRMFRKPIDVEGLLATIREYC